MDVEIMFREVETIPEDASVCHYDELSDQAKHCLACLVREETATSVGLKTANELTQYDGIKYTTYYELRRRDPPIKAQPSD